MRLIKSQTVALNAKRLIGESASCLPEFVIKNLHDALDTEPSPLGRDMLKMILENASIAQKENIPLCQDSGLPKVILRLGTDLHIEGDLNDDITKAVREAFSEKHLRRSAADPITRENLHDLIPTNIFYRLVPGETLEILTISKGGGCENKSVLTNLKPTSSLLEIKDSILSIVKNAGPDSCPPYYIGICIGSSFDSAPKEATLALLDIPRGIKGTSREEELSHEFLKALNSTGIGPMALGGKTTVLGLRTRIRPTHIASLPLAVNISCHSFRYGFCQI